MRCNYTKEINNMNTRRFILTNIIVWLPMLVLDRLSRHIAIATTTTPEVWEDQVAVLFANTWNPSLAGGYDLPAGLANGLALVGVAVFVVCLLTICKQASAPVLSLWSLIPTILFSVSNLADRLIWGMVSDPLVLTLGSGLAVGFNIADVLIAVGVVATLCRLWAEYRHTSELYYLAAEQGFNYGGTR